MKNFWKCTASIAHGETRIVTRRDFYFPDYATYLLFLVACETNAYARVTVTEAVHCFVNSERDAIRAVEEIGRIAL